MKKVYSLQNWEQSKRYKIGEIVLFNGGEYQNVTGGNSSPSLEVDFTEIGFTNIQTATSLVSGSVKTNITEADPIVYVKTSIDDLLSDKADLVGGKIPLNQLSDNVVVKFEFIDKEIPTGIINGTNTTFALANTPVTGSDHVYRNGLLQEEGSGNDYTISGNTITFLTSPLLEDKIRVTYRKQ